jgi:hypothetical protein
METELISEMLVYAEHLMLLVARDFIEFGHHTGFKKYLACVET